jgi:hypothetical protein
MEVFKRWSDQANVYGCATHRRKGPSICGNTAVIEMGTADAAVLAVVEQALDPELLAAVVDRTAEKLPGQAHRRAQLKTERVSLEAEIRRLTAAIAAGGDLAPLVEALRERESRRQQVAQELKARSATFDGAKLRQSLQKHTKDWRAMLRGGPRTPAGFCESSLPSGSCSRRTRPAGVYSGEKAISAYYFKWRPQAEPRCSDSGRNRKESAGRCRPGAQIFRDFLSRVPGAVLRRDGRRPDVAEFNRTSIPIFRLPGYPVVRVTANDSPQLW